jgi:peptidoglycan-associated lipoprotein
MAAAALCLSACATTPEEAPPPPQPQPESEFVQDEALPPEPEPEPQVVAARAPTPLDLASVYFDFDMYNVREDARPVLRSNADEILGGEGVITVEGHCDERGSEEYNLALGERRASMVRKYLVNLGVPADRLRTLSYGEAKPAVQGHDESAWRWNRRANFRASQ